MKLTPATLRIAFALVVAGGLAAAWIEHGARRTGANENKLQEVRRVITLKTAEGNVVDKARIAGGKRVASSHALSELSRPAAIRARRILKDSAVQVPNYLQEPIGNLLTHDDNLERENADLRQLATVDTTKITNLTERLELSHQELELTPKAQRCGRKCGVVLGILGTLAAVIALGR